MATNANAINYFSPAKWVVSKVAGEGTHTTLGGALGAASAGDTIVMMPGTYTENNTISIAVNITAYTGDNYGNVTIVGENTINSAIVVTFSSIELETNSNYFLNLSGTAYVYLRNCNLICQNNTGINCTGGTVNAFNCYANITATGNALFTISGSSSIGAFYYCNFQNSILSTTASTFSGNALVFNDCISVIPITLSGNSAIQAVSCYFVAPSGSIPITHGGTFGNSFLYNCYVSNFGGSSSAISIGTGAELGVANCVINSEATNVITGAGTLYYANVSFITDSTINITTQVPLVRSNDALNIAIPGAYPYTASPQDALIVANTSSAHTINLPASPATGEQHIIKDNTGSAGTNNLTVSGNGKNIDGASTYIMNVNYGSATFVYNSTQWNVI